MNHGTDFIDLFFEKLAAKEQHRHIHRPDDDHIEERPKVNGILKGIDGPSEKVYDAGRQGSNHRHDEPENTKVILFSDDEQRGAGAQSPGEDDVLGKNGQKGDLPRCHCDILDILSLIHIFVQADNNYDVLNQALSKTIGEPLCKELENVRDFVETL